MTLWRKVPLQPGGSPWRCADGRPPAGSASGACTRFIASTPRQPNRPMSRLPDTEVWPSIRSPQAIQRETVPRVPIRPRQFERHQAPHNPLWMSKRSGSHSPVHRGSRCGWRLYSDAEHDVAWLLGQLAKRDARIAELQARLARNAWAFSLPW